MATAKKTTRLSVARISKPGAEKAVPRGGVKAVSLKSSKQVRLLSEWYLRVQKSS